MTYGSDRSNYETCVFALEPNPAHHKRLDTVQRISAMDILFLPLWRKRSLRKSYFSYQLSAGRKLD
jgi:hypothetical protein